MDVDPLDGTKEFIKRNGEFTVKISSFGAELMCLCSVLLCACEKRTLFRD